MVSRRAAARVRVLHARSRPAWQLFSAREDGSAPVQITPGRRPNWSPDGAWIAFVVNAGVASAIYAVKPDGTGLHRVVESFEVGPYAWSPDSSKIAFTTGVPLRKYLPPGQEISVANADGSGVRQLTDLGQQSVFDDAPTWSPDGDQILFRRIYLEWQPASRHRAAVDDEPRRDVSGRARRGRVLGTPFVAGGCGRPGPRAKDVPGRPGIGCVEDAQCGRIGDHYPRQNLERRHGAVDERDA